MISGRVYIAWLFLFAFAVTLWGQADPFVLSHEPGVYNQNIVLNMSANIEHEDILYRFAGFEQSQLISKDLPPVLSAPEGGKRRYRIELFLVVDGNLTRQQLVDYVIDRQKPYSPQSDLVQGSYNQSIEFSPYSSEDTAHFRYSMSSPDGNTSGNLDPGNSLSLPGSTGRISAYQVQIYAVDHAGNRSDPRLFRYVVDRRSETRVDSIPVISPAQGNFANPQMLYIDTRGFEHLSYSMDGEDPRLSGTEYRHELMLPSGSDQLLRVYGITHDGRELYASVTFSAGIQDYASLNQGQNSVDVIVPAVSDDLFYRVDDRPAGRFDSKLDRALSISIQPGSLRALPLRIYDQNDDVEYRYLFLMDGRRPREPDVELYSWNEVQQRYAFAEVGTTISRRLKLRIRADQNAQTFYRIDGQEPQFSQDITQEHEIFREEEFILPSDTREISLAVQSAKSQQLFGQAFLADYHVDGQVLSSPEISIEEGENAIRLQSETPVYVEFLGSEAEEGNYFSSPLELYETQHDIELTFPPGISGELNIRARALSNNGAVSAESTDIPITIDSLMSEGPDIVVDGREVTIIGESGESIMYRLLKFGGESGQRRGDFLEYDGSFRLPEETGQNIGYIVEAYAIGNENDSAISRSDILPVHTRNPQTPRLSSAKDIDALRGDELELFISNREPAVSYFYSLGVDGQAPSDPLTNGTLADGSILIHRDLEKPDQSFELRVVPVSQEDASLIGEETILSIRFDNSPPPTPRIIGGVDGRIYSSGIELRLESEPEAQILYSITRDDGTELASSQTPYLQPIFLSGIEGRRVTYSIRSYAVDAAGNTSEVHQADFTIDRDFPVSASLIIRDSSGNPLGLSETGTYVSNDRISLGFESPDTVVYELSSSEENLNTPDAHSMTYDQDIILEVPQGSEQDFQLLFRTIDDAGNLGPISELYRINIDRKSPSVPPSPQIERDGNEGVIRWFSDGDTIEFALNDRRSTPSDDDFLTYDGPILWSVDEQSDELVLYYRAIDEAGNSSEIQSTILPMLMIAPLPKISGVQDGGTYIQTRTVELFPNSGGLVRYEITSDGSEPPEVSNLSPVWSSRMNFQAVPGESVEYRVKLRQYIPGYEPSRELAFSFTLDRNPPLPPSIVGFDDRVYSSTELSIEFQTEDDGSAIYSINSYEYPSGQLPNSWNNRFTPPSGLSHGNEQSYQGAFVLEGQRGKLMLYEITAYSYDEAGNRSAQDRVWYGAVDRRNVFVSPEAELGGDGSRNAPFARIEQAVQLLSGSERTEIVLASGNYSVEHQLDIDTNTYMYGSFDPISWEKSNALSYVFPDKSFRSASLFDVHEAQLTISSAYISNSAVQLDSLVSANDGQLVIQDSSLAASGSSRIVVANASDISIDQSEVLGYELRDAVLLYLEAGSTAHITGSMIGAEQLPDFLEDSAHGSYILIRADDSTIISRGSQILPASGDSTIGVYLRSSRLTAEADTEIRSGSGKTSATALYIENSELELLESQLRGDVDAPISSLVVGRNSQISAQGSELAPEAAFGATGFTLRGGALSVDRSRFSGQGARDFVSPIILQNLEQALISRTTFEGMQTAEYIAVQVDGNLSFTDNHITLTGDEDYAAGLQLSYGAQGIISNNVFAGSTNATALQIQSSIGELNLEIVENTFAGWGVLLSEYRDSFRSSTQSAGNYRSIQQLEQLDSQGFIFNDNEINQGL